MVAHEVLFRGKRTDNGEWVEGDLIHNPWGVYIQVVEEIKGGYNRHIYKIRPETIGQYSGVPDMDGKPIFENDIARYYAMAFPVTGQIIFDTDKAAFIFKLSEGTISLSEHLYLEIIGNIHDNPELLKGNI